MAVGGLLHEEKEIVTEEVVSKIIARYYEYRDFDSWPLELRLWWWSFDLDHVDATNLHCKINRLPDQLGLAFSPAYGLYQIRRFGEGPKTYIQPELLTASPTVFHGAGRPYILVFTEDALSAYKVAKHGGVTTLPLYGTRSVTSEMKLIASRATKVYGWFDPDWAGDKCGLDLVRQVPGAELIHTAKQPKSVSILEIKDVVKGL